MKSLGRKGAWIVGLLVVALLAGCGGGSGSNANGALVSTPRQFRSLQFTLQTRQSVWTRGTSIPLTFTMQNVGTTPIHIVGSNCATMARITQGNQTVGPTPTGCGGGSFTLDLAPGATQNYALTWDQKDLNAQQAAPGQYAIEVWFTGGTINGENITLSDAEIELSANPIQVTIL